MRRRAPSSPANSGWPAPWTRTVSRPRRPPGAGRCRGRTCRRRRRGPRASTTSCRRRRCRLNRRSTNFRRRPAPTRSSPAMARPSSPRRRRRSGRAVPAFAPPPPPSPFGGLPPAPALHFRRPTARPPRAAAARRLPRSQHRRRPAQAARAPRAFVRQRRRLRGRLPRDRRLRTQLGARHRAPLRPARPHRAADADRRRGGGSLAGREGDPQRAGRAGGVDSRQGHGRYEGREGRDAAQAGGTRSRTDTHAKEMIEKTATRVLDGATITRQSGRGRLVVVKGPDRGETIAIAEAPLTIGSGGGCDVLLSDPTISRKHLGIDPGPAGLVLRDLGSTNGSFVQGSRFNELTLGFGTEVTIGKTVLKYLPDRGGGRPRAVGERELRLAGRTRRQAAPAVSRARRRRGDRSHRADRRRDRHRQGAARRGDPPAQPAQGRAVHRVRLRRGPRRADRIGAVRTRARRVHGRDHAIARAPSRRPTAARCSSTRSASWRPACSRRCCARWTSSRCGRWAGRPTRALPCASSRPPTATCAPRSRRAGSARTSTIASRSCAWPCRRCASAPTTSRCWCSTSCASFAATACWRSRRRISIGCASTTGSGNVRELRNVIERACAVSHGNRLELEDALDDRPGAAAGWNAPAVNVDLPFKEAKARIVESFERDYITDVAQAPQGEPVGGVAQRGDRSQAPARAAAQARAARVGRLVT